jgi:RHS repeat-associated protein
MVQTYDYDPYGNAIMSPATGPLTDFRYAGMFYHAASGLYLTQYRAYDPRTARWLSRDPIGEIGWTNTRSERNQNSAEARRRTAFDPLRFGGGDTNLFSYVRNDPINRVDRDGRFWIDLAVHLIDWTLLSEGLGEGEDTEVALMHAQDKIDWIHEQLKGTDQDLRDLEKHLDDTLKGLVPNNSGDASPNKGDDGSPNGPASKGNDDGPRNGPQSPNGPPNRGNNGGQNCPSP